MFLCSLMHHVCLCLPGGSQICYVPACALSLPEGSQSVLCSLMHHVCLCLSGESKSVFVLANAPRLSVSSWRIPNLFFAYLLVESISSTSRPLRLSFKSRLYKFKLTCIERT